MVIWCIKTEHEATRPSKRFRDVSDPTIIPNKAIPHVSRIPENSGFRDANRAEWSMRIWLVNEWFMAVRDPDLKWFFYSCFGVTQLSYTATSFKGPHTSMIDILFDVVSCILLLLTSGTYTFKLVLRARNTALAMKRRFHSRTWIINY